MYENFTNNIKKYFTKYGEQGNITRINHIDAFGKEKMSKNINIQIKDSNI